MPDATSAAPDVQDEDIEEANEADSASIETHEPDKQVELPAPARPLLVPKVTDRRMLKTRFDSYVVLDVEWSTSGLPRPTRAVKGALVISDLFDEDLFQLLITIEDPLVPGEPFEQKDKKALTFEYNRFVDAHQRIMGKDLKDLKFRFEVEAVLYQDDAPSE